MPYKVVRRGDEYCVAKSDTGEIEKCYATRREALKLLRALYANVEDARRAADEDELDEVYRRWRELVNMSASELERWAASECSRKASLSRAPIERNLHLLRTPKEKWGAKEIRWAKRTISFISRMRAMEQGKPVSEGCPSKRDISLMNWAHRPSAQRADIVSLRFRQVACQRVRLDEVQHPERIWVLAMPFDVVDSYNTFFSQRTERRTDLVPEQVPVFDFHGLRGGEQDVQPIGKTLRWEKRDEGWWALVELDLTDARAERFMRAAAECNLEASVGMLRAGMYPQPPVGGIFDKPTELLQAPVSELSLIIPSETERAANEAAIGGYEFSLRKGESMCQDCNQNDASRAEIETMRATIEALRAEVEKMKKEKEEAEKAAAAERAARRRDQYAQRMMQMSVPQSIVNELLDIFGDVPEGSQDRIIDLVGRLVDHVRAMYQSVPTDGQRAAPSAELRSMLTSQVSNFAHASHPDNAHQADERQIELDREMIRSRLASYNARNGTK